MSTSAHQVRASTVASAQTESELIPARVREDFVARPVKIVATWSKDVYAPSAPHPTV